MVRHLSNLGIPFCSGVAAAPGRIIELGLIQSQIQIERCFAELLCAGAITVIRAGVVSLGSPDLTGGSVRFKMPGPPSPASPNPRTERFPAPGTSADGT